MSALYESCAGCGAETPSERCFGCFHDFGPGLTAPSNANTSGLVSEIDAEMEGRQRGYADLRGELLFRCRDRIVELEAELSQANANGASHWSRATAAESRADRLAKALERAADDLRDIGTQKPQPTNSSDPEHENYLRRVLISLGQVGNTRARAALQQETQP
ncbi:hypothetical protein [uncultured Brevundimonas sp.]|uniref:hypothetical protein n=1 Tax=uncultured Brevundimonas sp. TaxID=213418 RepID=UPI0025F05A73|nr:hypothetical protein [uncultured Brevundimonas sp.]